jgi:hypothetical protein
MSKRTRKRLPRLPENAEVILKQLHCAHRGDSDGAPKIVPTLAVLANSEGFRYLSKVFEYLADHSVFDEGDGTQWDHEHVRPTDDSLSDRIELYLATMTSQNRDYMFQTFGVDRASAARECASTRYRHYVDAVDAQLEQLDQSSK